MSVTETLVADNELCASSFFDKGNLPMAAGKKVTVLACMDAHVERPEDSRLKEEGAHIIREAGRPRRRGRHPLPRHLPASAGTEESILIQHLHCGMLPLSHDDVKRPVRGFYDVRTGRLSQLEVPARQRTSL